MRNIENKANPNRIGVIYYSQSGQLRHILDLITRSFSAEVIVDFIEIKPLQPFPFPWTTWEFFDKMPEAVRLEGIPVEVINYDASVRYDLILLGYQPWFLSPSLPITGFFSHPVAKLILKDTKVITVVGARNMWLNAQEKVKSGLINLGAHLVGNMTFIDTTSNILSTITILRWAFTGKKEATKWLPQAGIQPSELNKAPLFGQLINQAIHTDQWSGFQAKLTATGGVAINPQLILLEQTGIKRFRVWADAIKKLGPPGDDARRAKVKRFQHTLFVGIFFLSPLNDLVSKIKVRLKAKSLSEDMKYFSSVDYKPDAI